MALQRAQAYIHKGLVPLLQTLDSLKSKQDKENLKKVLDAFQLLALGSFTLTTARRQAMALDLFPPYRALCVPSRPFTDLLFGDDTELLKTTKQLKEANTGETRLGYAAISKTGSRGRGTTRGRGNRAHSFNPRGRGKPFLGGKAPHRRRGAYHKGSQQQPAHQRTSQAVEEK